MVICLEWCADLHMAQLMPLPLTISCFSKIQVGFTFLVLAYPGSPGKRAIKRVMMMMMMMICIFEIQILHFVSDTDTRYFSDTRYFLVSPTHSFTPGLKLSFSANPSHCSPSFPLFKYSLRWFPRLFAVISEHICFLLLIFLFLHFLVVGCMR